MRTFVVVFIYLLHDYNYKKMPKKKNVGRNGKGNYKAYVN